LNLYQTLLESPASLRGLEQNQTELAEVLSKK
jgi:hypothetical protein